MERWDPASDPCGPRLDLAGMGAEALSITNQMLGEGEVSIRIDGEQSARIRESVFTGLWRVCVHDAGGTLVSDWIEAASMPRIVVEAARRTVASRMPEVAIPPGALNSPALLAEIAARMQVPRAKGGAHVINLTLFPMTSEDYQVLESALPAGPVAIMSRGFGNCRVISTGARDVWRVQYFNNMNMLILDTIEIVEVPEIAIAAADDLANSRERLADLVEWMDEMDSEQIAE